MRRSRPPAGHDARQPEARPRWTPRRSRPRSPTRTRPAPRPRRRSSTSRDPARALGPDGAPAVSRRAPIWEDVPDEKWNDWRWQLSHRVNDLEEIEQILDLTDEEREGLSAPGQVPGRHHAVLHQPDRPERPERPDPPPGHPDRAASTAPSPAMMEDSLAEDRHSPVPGPRPSLPGPRPDARHDPVRELLPLLHAVADRRRPDPELQPQATTRPSSSTCAGRPQVRDVLISGGDGLTLAPKLFESILRGLREIPHIEIIRIGSARAGLPAAADRRRAVRDAREVPPALDQPPLQPPQRDHARGLARGRQADQGRPAGRQPERAAGRASTTASTSSARSSTSSSRTGSGRTTSTSATWSRAPATSGRRSARASRSWRACAATPRATRCRPTSSMRPAAAARSRSCPTT